MKESKKDHIYQLIETVEKQQSRSFKWTVLLSLLIVTSILAVVVVAYARAKEQNKILSSQIQKNEILNNKNKMQQEVLSETVDAIDYLSESIDGRYISDEARKRLKETELSLYSIKRQINYKYQIGDSLYIWAQNGLLLRNEPKGQRIGSNDFGDFVRIIEETNIELKDTILRKNSFIENDLIIAGKWVKVNRGGIGYMFDGYLSNLPPPQTDSLTLQKYFNQIKGIQKFNSKYSNDSPDEEHLQISNCTLLEAYLLARLVFPIEQKLGLEKTNFIKHFNKWIFSYPGVVISIEKRGLISKIQYWKK